MNRMNRRSFVSTAVTNLAALTTLGTAGRTAEAQLVAAIALLQTNGHCSYITRHLFSIPNANIAIRKGSPTASSTV